MRSFLKLVCLGLVTMLCHAANQQATQAGRPTAFPVVTSYNLEKAKVTLPQDLRGKINLLLLTFEREQQKDADSWIPVVKDVEASRHDFHHYFLPVFTRENALYRWWLNSSLRSSLVDRDQIRATIPLYLKRQTFLSELQIASDREISVLLVEKNGRVIWRTNGPLTEDKKIALEAAIVAATNAAH